MGTDSKKVRIVCISDTHNKAPGEGYTLPKGDVLIHAGDLSNQGSYHELKRAADWLEKADFAVKIVVAGNHDLSLDPDYRFGNTKLEKLENCREMIRSIPGVVYLQHSSVVVEVPGKEISFRAFGSPYSARHPGRFMAFQYSNKEAGTLWDAIPTDTDVLITHTPPATLCDKSQHWPEGGCSALTKALSRVRPALHVCGHCHEGRGAQTVKWSGENLDVENVRVWEDPGAGNKKMCLFDLTGKRDSKALERGSETAVVNASMVVRSWSTGTRSFNKPIVVDLAF